MTGALPNQCRSSASAATSPMITSAGDLTDWVELMEAVEALRPMWPEQPSRHAHQT